MRLNYIANDLYGFFMDIVCFMRTGIWQPWANVDPIVDDWYDDVAICDCGTGYPAGHCPSCDSHFVD